MLGDSCWVLSGDEMRMFEEEVGLCMFGVEAPHMLCERLARVVRMVRTSGVEGQMLCYML
nr:hypothetical protein [uncultured Prevotella sp.]